MACVGLAVVLLANPIMWLQVTGGDLSAPDIYIYGAFITGKDRSFWGISFAWKFQLSVIAFFIATNVKIALVESDKEGRLVMINLVLLLLFPFWMSQYVDGVICNSDSVHLTVHRKAGWFVYWGILVLNVLQLYFSVGKSFFSIR